MREACHVVGVVAVLCVIALAFGFVWFWDGLDSGIASTRQEAVDAGVAEWTVDSKGVKGFRWKSPTP